MGKRVLGLAATVRGPSQRGLATVSFGQFGQPAAVLQSSPAAPASAPSSGEVTVKISVCPVTGEDVRAVRCRNHPSTHMAALHAVVVVVCALSLTGAGAVVAAVTHRCRRLHRRGRRGRGGRGRGGCRHR